LSLAHESPGDPARTTTPRTATAQPDQTSPTASASQSSAPRSCTWDKQHERSLETEYKREWSEMLKHSRLVDIDHDGLDDRVVTLGARRYWGDSIVVSMIGCSIECSHSV